MTFSASLHLRICLSFAMFYFSSQSYGSPESLTKLAGQAPPQLSSPQTLPLLVVHKSEFCRRLSDRFASYGQTNGYDKKQTLILAGSAPQGLVQDFRAGRATDFISAVALDGLASGAVIKPASDLTPNPHAGYLPLAGVIGFAMGIESSVSVALSVGELRFLPHAQQGIDIVVIAQNAAAMTAARAQNVASLAKSMGIRISVVWVGAAPTEKEVAAKPSLLDEAKTLAWIAAMTGGRFANLGGSDSPCAATI